MVEISIASKQNGPGIGLVRYDEGKRIARVETQDTDLKAKIESYLATKREFKIPQGPEMDDYKTFEAAPTDSRTYFDLTMCTLYTNTGVWVDWSTERET